jgi:hypothetical protein
MFFRTKLILIPLFFFLLISTGYAKSNDPFGDIYIAKKFGDLSNCGPIAALMLSKYIKKELPTEGLYSNIKYARKSVQSNVDSFRWWRMSDIKKYFSHENIKHTSLIVRDSETIKDELDKNGIVVINVNMNNLSRGGDIGKPYFTFPIPGGWGHFLVIVGYKEVNNKLVFEIHDSFVKKGNNRSYFADDILYALKRYNPEILVVKKDNQKDYYLDTILADYSLEDIFAEDDEFVIAAEFSSRKMTEKFKIGIEADLKNGVNKVTPSLNGSDYTLIHDSLDRLLDSEELTVVSLAEISEFVEYHKVITSLNQELASFDGKVIKEENANKQAVNKENVALASVDELQN